MSVTDDRPRLEAPEGIAMSLPAAPEQWHGHPYVWAFHALGGVLGPEFVERVCAQAEAEEAPPDAVYKTKTTEGEADEWITVGMIANADQQRQVREGAAALVAWSDALRKFMRTPEVKPLSPADTTAPAEGEGEPETLEEHEYVIVYRPTHLTGVVKARSLLEACQKLTPGEQFKPSGYGVLDFKGDNDVLWHVGFDACKSEVMETTDERVHRPYKSPTPVEPPRTVPAGGVVIRRKRAPKSVE
jgi:hypothetical protein